MPGFRTRSGSAEMAAAEEDGDIPVSQSEIDNLRKLVGEDPVLEKKVADGLLICGDWNSTLRRFCQFAKQMPTKQGRSRPQPQTDGLHYLAEAWLHIRSSGYHVTAAGCAATRIGWH
mmetsp:Transcript_46539/g.122915  ORF Transcript_46539/g.122915 Transcript_46539/m.122915 type:complete len:117 (+) Transcript_46539:118-468(+)